MATALSIGQDISKRKIFQACPLVVAFDRCGCFGVIPFICVCLLVEGAGCIRNFYAIGRPVIGGWDVFLPLMNTNILADVFDDRSEIIDVSVAKIPEPFLHMYYKHTGFFLSRRTFQGIPLQ